MSFIPDWRRGRSYSYHHAFTSGIITSSKHLKKNGLFNYFESWQQGYGAFTHSYKEKDKLINYVKGQEEHHKIKTLKEEYVELLLENKIEFKNEYLN